MGVGSARETAMATERRRSERVRMPVGSMMCGSSMRRDWEGVLLEVLVGRLVDGWRDRNFLRQETASA